ncbi:GSCFA domain-containing protein [Methylosinus sp. Ce-a6]|uniref:GSCFA domain-containing protein n=1 Tax=Methylosinus sp. Ce-a6 TaxID=2172005 RepID=UPI0019164C27|nr:GSCFA domain-containing protein [Methylosinus sp. Ce-a6]
MLSPYSGLESRSFWKTGVVEKHPLELKDLYIKKFDIGRNDWIATAGSCFAQHIANRLRLRGFQVIDAEPPPPGLDSETAKQFGFELYSARYGNVYTVRQLLQLIQECSGLRAPLIGVWEKNGRFYDALRPSVEPKGLSSPEAVAAHRSQHLSRVRSMLERTDLLVFTLGLTEAWIHLADGTVYPTAPGTIVGCYDPSSYAFKNFSYDEVLQDFLELRTLLKSIKSDIRFMLTVSPVPLTATAGREHVLAATVYSKSVLRAVAGYLAMSFPDIDYFPSYEIIAGAPARGFFYENNLRSISAVGVDVVMRTFFRQHGAAEAPFDSPPSRPDEARAPNSSVAAINALQEVFCDEVLIEAFAP